MPATMITRVPCAAAVVLALCALPQPGWTQGDAGYPSRPIRLIVGFAAGGGNDLMARLVGQKLSEYLGQNVIIENKAGAGGRLAIEFVKGQPADGYTITVAATGQMAVAAAIYPKLSYHPTRDFVPLTMIASFPLILAGPVNEPIKTVKDLVAYGKAHPDKSNYASSSPAFTITTELFKLKTGMPAVMVPYKSSNEMMLSIAGGQTLFSIADGPPTVPLVQGDKIRALAVSSLKRSAAVPDIPTTLELGYPNSEYVFWIAVFAPRGTPPEIIDRLHGAIVKALNDPGIKEGMQKLAAEPMLLTTAEFERFIRAEIASNAALVKAAGIQPN